MGHSHVDHISGLLSFIGLRNRTKGANDKPLDVFFPFNDVYSHHYIDFINKIFPQYSLKYKLDFHYIDENIDVNPKIYIKPFKVDHCNNSLGFCVYEKSKRLKHGIDQATIEKVKRKEISKDDIMEQHDIKHFAYTLDNAGFDLNEVKDVKEIVLDCTFLNANDRDIPKHATLIECNDIIAQINCKKAYLAHISPRYNKINGVIEWTSDLGYYMSRKDGTTQSYQYNDLCQEKSS